MSHGAGSTPAERTINMKTFCPFDGGLLLQFGIVGYWHCPLCGTFFTDNDLEHLKGEEVQILTQPSDESQFPGELSDTPWLDGEN